jgi:hypothetical protein
MKEENVAADVRKKRGARYFKMTNRALKRGSGHLDPISEPGMSIAAFQIGWGRADRSQQHGAPGSADATAPSPSGS